MGAIDRIAAAIDGQPHIEQRAENRHTAEYGMIQSCLMGISPAPGGGVVAILPGQGGHGVVERAGEDVLAGFRLFCRRVVAPARLDRQGPLDGLGPETGKGRI